MPELQTTERSSFSLSKDARNRSQLSFTFLRGKNKALARVNAASLASLKRRTLWQLERREKNTGEEEEKKYFGGNKHLLNSSPETSTVNKAVKETGDKDVSLIQFEVEE